MKYILTSTDKDLNYWFNSRSFIDGNYTNAPDYSYEYLDLGHVPVIGEYMYFHGDYYEQHAVMVEGIIYTKGTIMVKCAPAKLSDIDSYLYDGNEISVTVKDDIIACYVKNKEKYLQHFNKRCEREESLDWLGCLSGYIQNSLELNNNIIDTVNISYVIKDVLAEKYPDEFKWHRPAPWEYSEF